MYRMNRGDVTFEIGPLASDLEPEIPFCSESPERMKILDWYLEG
jgi:hypothetical protein